MNPVTIFCVRARGILRLWPLAIVVLGGRQILAQSSLGESMAQSGKDWIIGQWEGHNDNGDRLRQSFAWDLDKHVVVSQSETPRWVIKGTSGLDPELGHVVFVGFSNRGGAIKGTWGEHEGWPMMKLQGTNREGRTWKGAVVYRKQDATTMEVRVFGLKPDGTLNEEPQSTITYQRK